MGTRREWIEHDYSRSIIVSRLQISLFQQGKTQTEPGFNVVRVFVEQVAKDLLSLKIVAFAHCPVALVVRLLVGRCDDSLGQTGAGETKHEGGHTEGRHPRKTPRAISLHDSHFLSDRQLCAYHCYCKTSPVFMDQRTKSSSSKSIPMSRANEISCCSTSRYFLRVEGGLAVSITPTSARHCITCLSRIAWPFTPMLRRK